MAIKRQIYIIILIFFLLCVSLFVFFVYPLMAEFRYNADKIIFQKKNVYLLESEFNDVQNFYKKYENYKPDLERLGQMFADSDNSVDFIKFIEETSANFNVQTEISTPLFYDDELSPYAILSISSLGNFENILNFINAIETDRYLIEVQSLDISKKEKEKTQILILLKVLAK